jgi:DNA processing protein
MSAGEELASWVRLAGTEGVGPLAGRQLLSHFGLPQQIFDAGFSALQNVVPERLARSLSAAPTPAVQEGLEQALAWASLPGNRILTLADSDYPQSLLDIPDPPLLLYIKGKVELLNRPGIAVVGSRNATAQGQLNAERFSASLSDAGWCVISGLALGVDAAAHRGGLSGAGSSVAVIGTGADIIYPARNRDLAHRLANQGCIVSEYPLKTPGLAANFPRRNRLISGLSRAVLVVEAAAQSGSLITARTAADQGRDVFAIPGSIHSPLSKGCHLLIKQGAKLVESAQDILEELGQSSSEASHSATAPAMPAAGTEPGIVLEALGHDPASADQLGERTGLSAASIAAALLELELGRKVETLPGALFRRLD